MDPVATRSPRCPLAAITLRRPINVGVTLAARRLFAESIIREALEELQPRLSSQIAAIRQC